MKPNKNKRLVISGALLVLVFSLLAMGCKELSNDPPTGGSLYLDIKDIQRQIGIDPDAPNMAVSDPIDIPDSVVSFALGALDISSRDENFVYDASTDISDSSDTAAQNLMDDITNSVLAQYIKFVQVEDLSSTQTYIEFYYPKSSGSRWQVMAVAFSQEIRSLADAQNISDPGTVTHAGYTNVAYTADSITDDTVITLDMIAAE